MPFQVTRKHEIAVGHRVVGQGGKCEHLHGHNLTFEFVCTADTLDEVGRVIDFGAIKERLCNWLERNWDHRMLLWDRDPLFRHLYEIDPTVVAVELNPTSEHLARLIVEDVGPEQLRGTGVRLIACTVHETGKCSATYEAE
jgi:6-pyruvoyltetrahydropterin/6-carboxytetrahydropterin synthase